MHYTHFEPEFLTDLETETQNESISILANDLTVSSIEDLYLSLNFVHQHKIITLLSVSELFFTPS